MADCLGPEMVGWRAPSAAWGLPSESGEGMAEWLDPEMVGWRAPSAARGVPPEFWAGLCSRFVSWVLQGREAIKIGVEINLGGYGHDRGNR